MASLSRVPLLLLLCIAVFAVAHGAVDEADTLATDELSVEDFRVCRAKWCAIDLPLAGYRENCSDYGFFKKRYCKWCQKHNCRIGDVAAADAIAAENDAEEDEDDDDVLTSSDVTDFSIRVCKAKYCERGLLGVYVKDCNDYWWIKKKYCKWCQKHSCRLGDEELTAEEDESIATDAAENADRLSEDEDDDDEVLTSFEVTDFSVRVCHSKYCERGLLGAYVKDCNDYWWIKKKYCKWCQRRNCHLGDEELDEDDDDDIRISPVPVHRYCAKHANGHFVVDCGTIVGAKQKRLCLLKRKYRCPN